MDGCEYFLERDNTYEMGLKGQGRKAICSAIFDYNFADALRYKMSIEVFEKISSKEGAPGLIFNVQEGGGSWNTSREYSDPPKNYDFVFLRYPFTQTYKLHHKINNS